MAVSNPANESEFMHSQTDFLQYWQDEGSIYKRGGDYDWMCSRLAAAAPRRVLEIGCGLGFSTLSLLSAGYSVLSLDSLPICLEKTTAAVAAWQQGAEPASAASFATLAGDVAQLRATEMAAIEDFAPDAVVCWLFGAPVDVAGQGQAVVDYREQAHQRVVALAARLPQVHSLHLVDRTIIPWQAKDLARETLLNYHRATTLQNSPFQLQRADALYRRLQGGAAELAGLERLRRMDRNLKSVTPVLSSALARRLG